MLRVPRTRAVSPTPCIPKSSGWIRPMKRLAIYIRDGERCVYCGRIPGEGPQTDLTLDHIVPRRDGGTNDPRNLLTACRMCNCSRRGDDFDAFVGDPARAHVLRRQATKDLFEYLLEAAMRKEVAARVAAHCGRLVELGWTPPDLDGDVPF